ncbi:MAG: HlyD family efflux transporter periplasmic adaptor subunit [Pseudomonadota bacterium]
MTEQATDRQSGPTLLDAVARTFSVELQTPPFPDRLLDLTRALITCPWAAVLTLSEDSAEIALGQVPGDDIGLVSELAKGLLDEGDGADVSVASAAMVARIAAPGGGALALAIGRAQGGQAAQALAYERLSLLAALSYAQNAHPNQMTQNALLRQVQAVAKEPSGDTLQDLADTLARFMSAEYAAVAFYTGGSVSDLKISGQDAGAKRASLPDRLRAEMVETARQQARSSSRFFAAAQGREDGLILHVQGATRNTSATLLAGATYALSQTSARAKRWTKARLMKMGAGALVLVGVALIPLPDRVDIPATVEASERRVLTAPFTAQLTEIAVRDSDTVELGAPLMSLETESVDLDLIEVRAERARALLDREAARAARRAADLRNAELDVERLDARIARLEGQVADAKLSAPIAGLVIAPDLDEKLGTTVRQGDPLIEIADPAALRLSLAIPDDQLGRLATGLEGQFRPDYDPTLSFSASVTDISPAMSIRAETPVLDGRAALAGTTQGLRPGLRGVFALQSDWKPAGQMAYEAIRNWVLLRVWF